MRNILVPVDFSDEAGNAAHYAANLAKQFGAELTLLHVFHLPVPVGEIPYTMDYSSLESENNILLNTLAIQIELQHHFKPKCLCIPGFVVEEVLEKIESKKYDLVVVGRQNTNKNLSFILGSTSATIMRKSSVPIIVVPGLAPYKQLKQLVLTCDFKQVKDPEILKPLTLICKQFDSEVSLLNVLPLGELPDFNKTEVKIKLDSYLQGIRHHFHFEEGDDVELGVDHYLSTHPSDMLILVPHAHGLFERLFLKTHSKSLLLHTSIPVLALPDCESKKIEIEMDSDQYVN